MREQARHQAIDILRGCSAVAVALFHFNVAFPELHDAYHRTVKWGWMGVSVFFVVSGFCIAAARPKSGPVLFWFRRLSRILPPYWASVLVVLAVVGLRWVTTGTNDVTALPNDLIGWFYTVAALPAPASSVPALNWAYWSLGYELAFYILMGLLAPARTGALLVVFSVLACFAPGYPFDLWCLFGLGVACYHFTQQNYPTAIALGVVCLAASFLRLGLPQVVAGTAAALVILFPPAFALNRLFRPFKEIGTFSYSLYLTHVPVGCYLLPYYLPWKLDRQLGPSLVQDAILLSGTLLFAYLFYRVAEKPSHDLARRVTLGTARQR
jgi:peptidoglycan/LPS O-acetylase OafA/YrhL